MEKAVETENKKKTALNKPVEVSDATFKDVIQNHSLYGLTVGRRGVLPVTWLLLS